MIEAMKLNEQELDQCYRTMRKGNTHLKTLAEVTGMEQRAFRARLFKGTFAPVNWPELNEEQVALFVQAMPFIQAVRDIEWKMLCAFSRLARKHANSWAKKMNGTVVDNEDYLQEAMLALLDAIYSYTQEETQFITFAWWVIHNRLTTAANKNSPFSPLTNEAMGLLKRFDEAKAKLNRHVTDEEVYEACGFTDDERAVISDAKVKVFNASHAQENASLYEGGMCNDYTETRRGIANEKDTVPCNYEVREAMERANLTERERTCVETHLCPHYGWQTELAKQWGVSKMTVGHTLQRALSKIKAAYLKRDVA